MEVLQFAGSQEHFIIDSRNSYFRFQNSQVRVMDKEFF